MGEYQNPKYRGTKNMTGYAQAFNASFGAWYDKISKTLQANRAMKSAKEAKLIQAKKDFNKDNAQFFSDNAKQVKDTVGVSAGLSAATFNLNTKYTNYAYQNQFSELDYKQGIETYKAAITPLNLLSGAFFGKTNDRVDLNDLVYGNGNGFEKLKLLRKDMKNMTQDQITDVFTMDVHTADMEPVVGRKVGDIYGTDITLSNGETINNKELLGMLVAAREPGNKLSTQLTKVDNLMDLVVKQTDEHTTGNLDQQFKINPGLDFVDLESDKDENFKQNVTELVNDLQGKGTNLLRTIYNNEMPRVDLFKKGDIGPDGEEMTEEMAARLNTFDYGGLQKLIADTDDDDVSEENIVNSNYVIAAQKGKIVDYLTNKYNKNLKGITRAKPPTIKDFKKSTYEIKTENQSELYNNYESDLSQLMEVYSDPDSYTTSDVKVSGKDLTTWLKERTIKRGNENADIMNAELDDGMLTIKVKVGMKSGVMQTKSWNYDLRDENHNGFYELIGGLTASLNDGQVVNENKRYDRTKSPY